jgi:pantoate--beta-alanine ligase
MGALHDGHASLVRHARHLGGPDAVVFSSIFVNPTQFGPHEDFSKYPRTLDADTALLAAAGCDAVFVPAADEMYPGIARMNSDEMARMTSVDPGPLADGLEGAVRGGRAGHFRGVCTVVAKLLHIVEPTHLLLGQKDFQQQAILRAMCRDLDLPVDVVTCPTVREPDGLAMSSRNRYLSPADRPRAVGLYEALSWAKTALAAGERHAPLLEAGMHQRLLARGLTPDYAVVAHPATLRPYRDAPAPTPAQVTGEVTGPAVFLIAARLGNTRLIDNLLAADSPLA